MAAADDRTPLLRLIGLSGLVMAFAACVPPPPADRPYLAAADIAVQLDAIDIALRDDTAVDWQTPGGDASGAAVPGDAYTDRLGRECRELELSERAGDDFYVRSEKFCLTATGAWLPDLPPGAGAGAVIRRPDAPSGDNGNRDLERRYANEKRRVERRYDGTAEQRRGLRRRFPLEDRRRVD